MIDKAKDAQETEAEKLAQIAADMSHWEVMDGTDFENLQSIARTITSSHNRIEELEAGWLTMIDRLEELKVVYSQHIGSDHTKVKMIDVEIAVAKKIVAAQV